MAMTVSRAAAMLAAASLVSRSSSHVRCTPSSNTWTRNTTSARAMVSMRSRAFTTSSGSVTPSSISTSTAATPPSSVSMTSWKGVLPISVASVLMASLKRCTTSSAAS